MVDLSLDDLPALNLSHLPAETGPVDASPANSQTREAFAREAAAIADRHRRLIWMAPSRDESNGSPVMQPETPGTIVPEEDDEPAGDGTSADVQGGRERGQIIHKLLEEVLTGETEGDLSVLTGRAGVLVGALGQPIVEDPAKGLSSAEIAGCVVRTLALPEIAALRPTLVPEFPVYTSALVCDVEQATVGITDATSFAANGKPQVVIDWKSDVDPAPQAIEHYRAQVRNYLGTMGIENGLIVFVTSGTVMPVKASVTVEPTS